MEMLINKNINNMPNPPVKEMPRKQQMAVKAAMAESAAKMKTPFKMKSPLKVKYHHLVKQELKRNLKYGLVLMLLVGV